MTNTETRTLENGVERINTIVAEGKYVLDSVREEIQSAAASVSNLLDTPAALVSTFSDTFTLTGSGVSSDWQQATRLAKHVVGYPAQYVHNRSVTTITKPFSLPLSQVTAVRTLIVDALTDQRAALQTLETQARASGLTSDGRVHATIITYLQTLGLTLQQRRARVMAALAETGGLSRQYFINLAKALGYDITIEEPDDLKWRWIVNVNGAPERVWYFRVGESVVGDCLEEIGYPDLETLFKRLKPAHTECLFTYSEGSRK